MEELEELERLAFDRDIAEIVFHKALHEASEIAENMRDTWRNQQSGSTDWRG